MIKDDQFFNKDNKKAEVFKKASESNKSEYAKLEEEQFDETLQDDEFEDLEENSNDKLKEIKTFLSNNKKPVIIAISVIALIIIIFVATILLGKNGNSDGSDNSVNAANTNGTNTTSTNTQISSENTTVGENPSVEVVAAEVAEIDDAQDPQSLSESGSGGAINASALKNTSTSSISNGIDVSKFQGKIDWTAVAATGIDFAMVRVGYRTTVSGVIYEDPYAQYNLQKAAEAGIKVGAYFFSSAVSNEEALEEAAWTTNFISKYSITYPVVFDCEGFSTSDSRMSGLSNSVRTGLAVTFLNYVKNAGYEPMFYSSKSAMTDSNSWDMSKINGSFKVWAAQYPSVAYPATASSTYSGTHAMWQYTENGTVAGISGKVDMNVAYFNYNTVTEAKDTSGVANADNPELGMVFTATNDQVTAKIETNLRSLPSTSGNVVATILNGQFVTRIATGDKGWSKISYNGQTVYAVTSLLTTQVTAATSTDVEAGITFAAANDQVTAKDDVNLRKTPNSSGSIVVNIKNGTFVSRTGIGDNGWSRLTYNGQTVYAFTQYLTTQANVATTAAPAATVAPVAATLSAAEMTFTAANDQVTAYDETNLRTLPSKELGTIVYLLKSGVVLKRTGINNDTKWSRLEYNGQVVYAMTNYLVVK